MANDPALAKAMAARLYALGPVTVRGMFGGHGVFLDGTMFGLIAGDTLYFKVDEGNRGDYLAAGCGPFSYVRHGRPIEMSYYRVPDDIIEAPDTLAGWGRAAFEVARRSKSARRGKS